MNLPLDQLKFTLSNLPASDRAELAEYLLHSLDPEEEEIAHEWAALSEKRVEEEFVSGRVAGIPASEVLQNLLRPGQ